MNPLEHIGHDGSVYSRFGHLKVSCSECGKPFDCYTEDPFVYISCAECEEKREPT